MKPPAKQKAGGRLLSHVLLCFFIIVLKCHAGEADRSQMVALEVIPPWIYVLIFVGCPLVVLARLKWGPSPWDIPSHIEQEKTQEHNDQEK